MKEAGCVVSSGKVPMYLQSCIVRFTCSTLTVQQHVRPFKLTILPWEGIPDDRDTFRS